MTCEASAHVSNAKQSLEVKLQSTAIWLIKKIEAHGALPHLYVFHLFSVEVQLGNINVAPGLVVGKEMCERAIREKSSAKAPRKKDAVGTSPGTERDRHEAERTRAGWDTGLHTTTCFLEFLWLWQEADGRFCARWERWVLTSTF